MNCRWRLAILLAAVPASAQQFGRAVASESAATTTSALSVAPRMHLPGMPLPPFDSGAPNLSRAVVPAVQTAIFPLVTGPLATAPRLHVPPETGAIHAGGSAVSDSLPAVQEDPGPVAGKPEQPRNSGAEQLAALTAVLQQSASREPVGGSDQVFDGEINRGKPFFEPVAAELTLKALAKLPGFETLGALISRRSLAGSDHLSDERRQVIELTREVARAVLADPALLLGSGDSHEVKRVFNKERPADDSFSNRAASPEGARRALNSKRLPASALVERVARRFGVEFPAGVKRKIVDELLSTDWMDGLNYFDHAQSMQSSPMHLLLDWSAQLETGRYLAEIKSRSDRLYRRFFPQFYREFPVHLSHFESVGRGAEHEVIPEDNVHRIMFWDPTDFTHSTDATEVRPIIAQGPTLHGPAGPEAGVTPPVRNIQGRIDTLLTFFHEYAHGIFDEAVFGRTGPWPLHVKRAYSAMTEGFAVMLELLLTDKMVAAREELGLTDRDVADLVLWKKARLHSLRRKRNFYAFGTLGFWHKIYKQEGEAGMLQFLNDLDGPRILDMPQEDLGLRLSAGNVELLKAYLTKSGDPGRRRTLARLAAGGKMDEAALSDARRILKKTSGPTLWPALPQ